MHFSRIQLLIQAKLDLTKLTPVLVNWLLLHLMTSSTSRNAGTVKLLRTEELTEHSKA